MTRREEANALHDARRWRDQPWRKWYSTKAWRLRRKAQLHRVPWCEPCKEQGKSRKATVANHNPPHRGDRIAFFHGPLESVCTECHDSAIQRAEAEGFRRDLDDEGWPADPRHPFNGGDGRYSAEWQERRMPTDLKPSAIPLTIVCGPPCAGKNTFVSQHASPDDVVIDLDAIMQAMTGRPMHHRSKRHLGAALDERNRMLRSLATDTQHKHAWFIIAAPDPAERRKWCRRLGGVEVVLYTPLAECVRRITADAARRPHRNELIAAAEEWWSLNKQEDAACATREPSTR